MVPNRATQHIYLWYLLLLVFTIIITIKLIWKQITSKYQILYCPFNRPLLGSNLHIQTKPEHFLNQFLRLPYQGNYNFLLLYRWKPFIVFSKSEYLKSISVNPKETTKSSLEKIIDDRLGPSSLIISDKNWKQRRNVLNHAFHISKTYLFATNFEKHARAQLIKLQKIPMSLLIFRKLLLSRY